MACKVLLLEDQTEITTIVQLILENEGFEIYEADTVGKAEQLAQTQSFGIAFVDGTLPDKSPLALVEELVKRECQVILMSGNFEAFKPVEGLACFYLEKPFRIAELLAITQQALTQLAVTLSSEKI